MQEELNEAMKKGTEEFLLVMRKHIKEYGPTKMSKEIGCSRITLYNSFGGGSIPSLELTQKVLKKLNCSIEIV